MKQCKSFEDFASLTKMVTLRELEEDYGDHGKKLAKEVEFADSGSDPAEFDANGHTLSMLSSFAEVHGLNIATETECDGEGGGVGRLCSNQVHYVNRIRYFLTRNTIAAEFYEED